MKLKADGVGLHRPAGQACPPERVLAFSDPLLRRATLVIESDHPLGRAAQVGDQKANTRVEFTWMPLDLGHDPAGVAPTLGLVAEAGVEAPDLVGRTAHRAREQGSDP